MGLHIFTFKFLFVYYFLGSVVNGVELQSRRTARSESRGLSDPIGMLSDQLLSSSSLIHQLISMKDKSSFQRRMLGNQSDSLDETLSLDINTNNSIDESTTPSTESSNGPKSSALIDDANDSSDPYANDPYRWRPAQTPIDKTTSPPMPNDYSPEPFVYICRDPSKCRIPNPIQVTRASLYASTTTPPITYLKYGYRKINATHEDESKKADNNNNDDDDDYKTIYRSQIRKVKKKRPINKRKKVPSQSIPDFNDMSLKELQDFMRHQSKKVGMDHLHKDSAMKSKEDKESNSENENDSSSNPFDLMMKEIKKIHKSNQLKKKNNGPKQNPMESFPNHRPMKPFIANNQNKQLSLDIMMKNLQSFSDSGTTTASTLTQTRVTARTTAFTVRPTFLPKSSSTTTTKTLKLTKTMSPFEIMLLRMKEKENSGSRSTPFTVRPTSTLRPKTEATTQTINNNNNSPFDLMSFKMKDMLESSSPSTVFTVRPTSTSAPRISTMSPFEMMVKRMKEKERTSTPATVFTVRPTATTTQYGSSQNINSELANLGISSLMKIMSNGAMNKRPPVSTPSIMKPHAAFPDSTPTVNSFIHFKSMDENISKEAEELSQENDYDRPPRRPTDPYYHQPTTSPFTVRPTKKIYGNNYHYQRVTTTTPHYSYYDHQPSTPFTVRPTYKYGGIYQQRTTKKVPFRPHQELNYQVRSTTPFTVFGKKKSYLSHSTPRASLAAFKHDVELKDPFSYDEDSFMSGMKGLQQDSKPHYIPDAQTSTQGLHDMIDDKNFQLDITESDEFSDINPFKTHPFESDEDEEKEEGSMFLAMNLSDYGHDDRPLMSSFMEESDEEEEDEDDYYDDFENYDLEEFINKLSKEKGLGSSENEFPRSVLPKSDNFEFISQLDEDISAPYRNEFRPNPHPSFNNFAQSTTPGPNRISSYSTLKFPNIPTFDDSFDANKNNYKVPEVTQKPDQGYYFRPDGVFSNTKIKLEPGALPDRPNEGTVFRDLPNMKEPHPQYPSNVKSPPPPVPTTADFVSQYLKNPYGSNFIRMEIDQDRFKHNRTKPGSIHVPLMIKNYDVHKAPAVTPKPIPKKKKPHMNHHHRPIPPQHSRPNKNHGKPKRRPSNKKPPPKRHHVNPMKNIISDLKNLQKVMFNLPNAIQDLPSYMKGLVSNQASFAGRAFTDQEYVIEEGGEEKTDEKIEEKDVEIGEEPEKHEGDSE